MTFEEQKIAGVFRLVPKRIADERGYFARTSCMEDLRRHGIDPVAAQCSVSHNPTRGTLRGVHFQAEPHGETKLIRCTRGAIFDVLVDLRPESPTYCDWVGVNLSAENNQLVAVPPGIAHGFLTLEPDSEVFYQISVPFHAPSARGVRWDDPAFGIEWPRAPELMSDRDRTYPDFVGATAKGSLPSPEPVAL